MAMNLLLKEKRDGGVWEITTMVVCDSVCVCVCVSVSSGVSVNARNASYSNTCVAVSRV